jgi:hypothetical protein
LGFGIGSPNNSNQAEQPYLLATKPFIAGDSPPMKALSPFLVKLKKCFNRA